MTDHVANWLRIFGMLEQSTRQLKAKNNAHLRTRDPALVNSREEINDLIRRLNEERDSE